MTKAAPIITAREINVAMKDMGPRDRVAGVESPGDRHAITGALCSAITNLADRDRQQPNATRHFGNSAEATFCNCDIFANSDITISKLRQKCRNLDTPHRRPGTFVNELERAGPRKQQLHAELLFEYRNGGILIPLHWNAATEGSLVRRRIFESVYRC
jgi:hypothetical protein